MKIETSPNPAPPTQARSEIVLIAVGLLVLIFLNLYLNNDHTNWRSSVIEIDSLGIAVSELVSGESGFLGRQEVKLILDRSLDDLNKGLATAMKLPESQLGYRSVIVADGNSPAYVAFAKMSFWLFGAQTVSLFFGYALLLVTQVVLLCIAIDERDGGVILGVVVLLLCFLLAFGAPGTPVFEHAQMRHVFVMRFFESLALVPLMHALYAIWRSDARALTSVQAVALMVQMALLFLAVAIRGTAAIGVVLVVAYAAVRLYVSIRQRRDWRLPGIRGLILALTGVLLVTMVLQLLSRVGFLAAGIFFSTIGGYLAVKTIARSSRKHANARGALAATVVLILFSLFANVLFFQVNLSLHYYFTRSTSYSTDAFWHRAVIGLGYSPRFLQTDIARGVSCPGIGTGVLVAGVADSNGTCIYLSEVRKADPSVASMPWNDLYTRKYENRLRNFYIAYVRENPGVFVDTHWFKAKNLFLHYLPEAFSHYRKGQSFRSTAFILSAILAALMAGWVLWRQRPDAHRMFAVAAAGFLLALAFVIPSLVAWPMVWTVINVAWATCFAVVMSVTALGSILWHRLLDISRRPADLKPG